MKGFYKMRLLACVLPLALGLSACGSSSSSAPNPGISPPDSSLTTVSYVLFSLPSEPLFAHTSTSTCSDTMGTGGGTVYGHGHCDSWGTFSPSASEVQGGLVDMTAYLYGSTNHEFDISEYANNLVSATLTMNLSVECRGGGTCNTDYSNQGQDRIDAIVAAVAAGIPLRIYLVANRDQSSEESVFISTIDPLATDDSLVGGTEYTMPLSNVALIFLKAHPEFALKFVGKTFAIYYGDRNGATDDYGQRYPDVSPKLDMVLKDYEPTSE